ncbi:hypothetical protein GBAR_LOCUS4323 [Geodia barretti]|uniref:Uncharacterized protein n=1 Tax=Geodia barretti TaxID=519541 RepID=A0AA35R6F6_GEOBA|nr:hypothetical protein GBAR_LOCUS4323 [Geodia barretti]
MSRRRGQELHTETIAGGAPSVMVVVRQSEPLRLEACSNRSVCNAGGADRLGDGENWEGQDFLQNPELMSCSSEECEEDSGWLVVPAREESGALSSQLVTGFHFTSSLPD